MKEDWQTPIGKGFKETSPIAIGNEGELRVFFDKLRTLGILTVVDGGQEFFVKISRKKIGNAARDYLTGGGRMDD